MPDIPRIFADHHPQPGYCLVLRPFNDASDHAWGAISRKRVYSSRRDCLLTLGTMRAGLA